MRSAHPMPGNPWPHDMLITVEDHAQTLLELLWVREAYGLHPGGEGLPPRLVRPPSVALEAPSADVRREWETTWPRLWHDAAAHAGDPVDPAQHEALMRSASGSAEREDLIRRIVGPDWGSVHGDAAFEHASYSGWSAAMRPGPPRPESSAQDPLRRDLDAVVAAWRAGMTTIVVIPCVGDHGTRIGDHGLLITAETWAASAAFRRALALFGRPSEDPVLRGD